MPSCEEGSHSAMGQPLKCESTQSARWRWADRGSNQKLFPEPVPRPIRSRKRTVGWARPVRSAAGSVGAVLAVDTQTTPANSQARTPRRYPDAAEAPPVDADPTPGAVRIERAPFDGGLRPPPRGSAQVWSPPPTASGSFLIVPGWLRSFASTARRPCGVDTRRPRSGRGIPACRRVW